MTVPEGGFHAVITDPPYGLKFMNKGWDHTVPGLEYWKKILKVCRPGAYLLALGSLKVPNGIPNLPTRVFNSTIQSMKRSGTPEHDGKGRWPANLTLTHHPDCVRRGIKKVKGSQLNQVIERKRSKSNSIGEQTDSYCRGYTGDDGTETVEKWDCHPECPVALLDKQSGELGIPWGKGKSESKTGGLQNSEVRWIDNSLYQEKGGASRFFYCAKASRTERNTGVEGRNMHPTVKPVALMEWLIKLVTPVNGTILDPFCGSGSTGIAALQHKCLFVGIDNDPESVEIAKQRIAYEEEQIKENEPIPGDLTEFLASLGLEEIKG
jgi:site-specific DNA-methyltransferase (adenine-specific)